MEEKKLKLRLALIQALYGLAFFCLANCFVLIRRRLWWLAAVALGLVWVHAFAGIRALPIRSKRRKICCHGCTLLVAFSASMAASIALHLLMLLGVISVDTKTAIYSGLFSYACHFLLFWNGIACVYLTSSQLGIKLRVVGAILGLIPVANLVALGLIIRTTFREVVAQTLREWRNRDRLGQQICATRYPILLVHGVFFRDNPVLNYWGRVPEELQLHGADIYYGNHQSALPVPESAQELAQRIRQIVEKTGCGKLNIIAHSKGGLDCRYAMAHLGVAPLVASLTTINTPHRGCIFADWLLEKTSDQLQEKVAFTYNHSARLLGDITPDFLAAVRTLTGSWCREFDAAVPEPEGVCCRSFGSVLGKASRGQFPLNLFYPFVKHFDGDNDGLVGESSFAWGESYTLLRPRSRRGISHADMIDLGREDIPGFDVREFYVEMVSGLKNSGF